MAAAAANQQQFSPIGVGNFNRARPGSDLHFGKGDAERVEQMLSNQLSNSNILQTATNEEYLSPINNGGSIGLSVRRPEELGQGLFQSIIKDKTMSKSNSNSHLNETQNILPNVNQRVLDIHKNF
mmetsp:Transcript_11007/g.16700  ORF Transcript_11007/g.16700 Transcript_11007/m.16700 type:complete len:125 (+) Transcript_11007:2840-3214(+)